MILWLDRDTPLPSPEQALAEPNGLLAAGGELTASRLLEAYRHGIFPWFSPHDPILWWSPDPRMVLMPNEFKLSDSLLRILKQGIFDIRTDTAFETVMRACAAPRGEQAGTWIDENMIAAYCELHRLGYAHSVEAWQDDELAGGLYGVSIGRMFYGESMFSRISNASKATLAHLTRQMLRWHSKNADFPEPMIDCQMYTRHLASLGGKILPREEFIANLTKLVNCTPVTDWTFDQDLF